MKKLLLIIGTGVIILSSIYILNYVNLIQPTTTKINDDERNKGISIEVNYKFYINPNILEFNLTKVPSDKSPADIFRVFLQASSALKEKNFDKIELKYNGKLKYILNGDYYKQLGIEFEEQNPIYTMRTFPENLYNPDGEESYSKWEGGMLGVFGKQMEDFNDFHKKWYIDDLKNEIK